MEPGFIWDLCGGVDWSFYARGHYDNVCYNELHLGYKGTTEADNKQAAIMPNRVDYSNATLFRNGFFFGGSLDYQIDAKKAKSFDKMAGYGDEEKLFFVKQ